MTSLINKNNIVSEEVLNLIAHVPTKSLGAIFDESLYSQLEDKDFMRIATYLAEKSYYEGGCPIGGVVIDNKTSKIVGKGHNTIG